MVEPVWDIIPFRKLRNAVKDPLVIVRRAACEAMARLDSVPSPALSALVEALNDRDLSVSRAATEALLKVADYEGVVSLLAKLGDAAASPEVRAVVAGALARAGEPDYDVGMVDRALAQASEDPHPTVRAAAIRALGRRLMLYQMAGR
ncbi:MAG: HEAT repeat domain-containing protein [bacterium]|nr:HEAT repeat domain-containing protein [bacterium]